MHAYNKQLGHLLTYARSRIARAEELEGFFYGSGAHRDLQVLTPSSPTRGSSD
eukprot:COSAG01_NODE_47471_length_390_cov_0.347079_1_plen_52_part_01